MGVHVDVERQQVDHDDGLVRRPSRQDPELLVRGFQPAHTHPLTLIRLPTLAQTLTFGAGRTYTGGGGGGGGGGASPGGGGGGGGGGGAKASFSSYSGSEQPLTST
jgi:uncharacterized membrane protein YgcG